MSRMILSLAGITVLNGATLPDEPPILAQDASDRTGRVRVSADLRDTGRPQLVEQGDLAGTPSGTIVMSVPGDWDEAAAARLRTLNVKFALQTITPEEDSERKELQLLQRRDIPVRSYPEIVAAATREARERDLVEALERYVRDVKQADV